MKNESIYAIYEIDLSYSDSKLYNNVFPRFNTPQDVAEKFLGLSKETLPIRIDSTEDKPNIHDKYVCITEHGQSNAEKSWLYPNGWQIVSNYLVGKGYTVIPISGEPTNIKGDNILDKTGLPLKDMIQYIKYADLFIGGSTAPTHISYSLGVPTIMIITNTWLVKEWPINYVYNDDERYCFGCYTKELKKGISSCNKRNPIPECSMSITPNMVINKINEVLLLLD